MVSRFKTDPPVDFDLQRVRLPHIHGGLPEKPQPFKRQQAPSATKPKARRQTALVRREKAEVRT